MKNKTNVTNEKISREPKIMNFLSGVVVVILIALLIFVVHQVRNRDKEIPLSGIIGGEKETPLQVPTFLQGAQIVFDKQMYYKIGKQDENTETFKMIERLITPNKRNNEYNPNRFSYELVSTSTKFSVIGAFNHAAYGLTAIDSGTSGADFLILQDPQGTKSLVPYIYLFDAFSNQNIPVASYYKNGKRIDYIKESDFGGVE